MENKKTNTQLLKEMQDIADEIERRKDEAEAIANLIDELIARYFNIREEIKNNSKNG